MKINFYRTASWLLEGISNVIRGATQVAATPLTWGIRIPLRGLITIIKGAPYIEENQSLQRLVADGIQLTGIEDDKFVHGTNYELHRKFQKCINRGQHTNIDVRKEKILFEKCKKHYWNTGKAAYQFLGLFRLGLSERTAQKQREAGLQQEMGYLYNCRPPARYAL